MLSEQRPCTTECIIRNEIKDWFKKLVDEKCGPNFSIRYISDETHFNVHTKVEISGSENQINQAAEFIRNTIDVLKYKMPWLNDNTYYVRFDSEKDTIKKELKNKYKSGYDVTYKSADHQMIGISFKLFNFRPDLDDTKKLQIDEIFKSFGNITPIFIAYHQTRPTRDQSSYRMASNILTTYHGTFLYFLDLQDIISLEMANKQLESDYDEDLEHDIQKHLQKRFAFLYQPAKVDYLNLKEFSNDNVLRYFIHKYHDHLQQIDVPNILTADEIQSLSCAYNIVINYHNIIHIDFRSATNDFCLIYHFDPKRAYFLNYDSKYATHNYTTSFNVDDSLDPLRCSKQFSCFVLRSQNNVAPQKSNSVLNCVAEHFRVGQYGSQLVLNRFDLNCVSKQNLCSLFNMAGRGTLVFDEMYFNLKTLIAVLSLERAEKSKLKFIKCCIAIENLEVISNDCQVEEVTFNNMDIELKVLSFVKNIKTFKINNSRILSSRMDEVRIDNKNVNEISISHSVFDISTLFRFLAGLQCTRNVTFLSCTLTSGDLIDETWYFIVLEKILFISMIFETRTLFKIFEKSEIQNRLIFQNCHFRFEEFCTLTLRPVNVEFHFAIFELLDLLTVLETLHKKSKILIHNSWIVALDDNGYIPNKLVQLEFIRFEECRFETQTLINVFGTLSKNSRVHFDRCELLHSSKVYPKLLTNLSNITFWDMKLNSHDLFVIWEILNENSSVFFRRCDITAESEGHLKISLKKKLKIQLADMTVPTEFARSFLQTESMVKFNNCCLEFMSDEFSDITIRSNVAFQNMTFDLSSPHMKSFANFTHNSKIQFWNCHFENQHFIIPSIVIKSSSISFYTTTFDLDAFVTLLEKVSKQSRIYINACGIRVNTQVLSIRRITIPSIHFTHMNLEIEMILCILKNFTSLSMLQFEKCKILCTNFRELPRDIKLTPTLVYFKEMSIDVDIFQMLVQKCSRRVTVLVENCDIISPGDNVLSNVSVEVERINFRNIDYSIGVLHILKYVIGHFIVEYHDELSNKELIEICINTPVHGSRLQLMAQNYTKLVCFELFAEFLRPLALIFDFDAEAEYDPPTHLIPRIKSLSFNRPYDWSALKIKFIPTNDVSVKLEFLRNGERIDLFYELNDLPDDSDECTVDYY